MQDPLAEASEGAGRVPFPCCYFARALCSSVERGLKRGLALGAVSSLMARAAHLEFFGNDFADRSYGGPVRLLKLARGKEHLCVRCGCVNAGIAVCALNPEELPDVEKPL